jgi:hypothetical protein
MKKLFILLTFFTTTTFAQKTIKLFNGKDLNNWFVDVPAMDKNSKPINPFIIRNGLLVSLGEPQGHLITKEPYENYRLELEYRFAGKPGNCGVLVHASNLRALYNQFPKSIEVQMMHDNAGDFWCISEDISVTNMEARRGRKENWGSIDGKERRIKNLTDNSEKPLGDWNLMVVECREDKIKVWLNGDVVNDGFGATVRKGKVALQAEGSEVEFRKVELIPF